MSEPDPDETPAEEPNDEALLDHLLGMMDKLTAKIAELTGRVESVEEALADAPTPEEDLEEQERLFLLWITWFSSTYRVEARTDKWNLITPIRLELAALHQAWLAAYSPKAGPWDKLTWHEALDRAMPRLHHIDNKGHRRRWEASSDQTHPVPDGMSWDDWLSLATNDEDQE